MPNANRYRHRSLLFSGRIALILSCLSALVIGCDRPERAVREEAAIADPVDRMQSAIERKDWGSALEHSRAALIAQPRDPEVLTQAAMVAAMNGDRGDAAKMMVDAAQASNYAIERVDFAVHALIDVGELYQAIDLLEAAVAAQPDEFTLRVKLAGLLCEAQLNRRVEPHYRALIRARQFDLNLLVAMTDSSNRQFSEQTTELMLQRNPQDQRVRLGQARVLMDERDADEARRVVEKILQRHPDFAPAHALLGQVLTAQSELDQLAQWQANSPPDSDQQADYWLTLGDWAASGEQFAEAARAYWQATRCEPNHSTAWTRLGMALRRLRDQGSAVADAVSDQQLRRIDQRAADLILLRKQFTRFLWSGRQSQRAATDVARTLAEVGRLWEAEAWAAVATTLQKDPTADLEPLRDSIIASLRKDQSWFSQRRSPELAIDLSQLPQPVISAAPQREAIAAAPLVESVDHLRLSEESARWGVVGIGANNNPSDPKTTPLTRSTGVGGGAVDYDLDGRADALVMGAGGTMLKSDSHPNELIRNLGRAFTRVTDQAQVGHTDYGQGLCVGDYNEDGFPDLFFANLGKNRLLRNNGDGTFADCSELLRDGGAQQWTMCAAMVDMNQDGITDLFTANYCSVENHPDQACPNDEGELGPCHPLRFAAEQNQFFAGTAEGRLVDTTSQWTDRVSPGRGMGILAGALVEGKLAVLIVNDMSANELYMRDNEGSDRLVESAALRGVAVDGGTRTQASMGIASGDLDGDGDLDLYITGFAQEYNIYYEQVADGCWQDSSSSVGMVRPTLLTLGFGCEAIDLDDDGVAELAVTNGDIGDFEGRREGVVVGYQQPFQLFRRAASGRFSLVDDDSWGDYFSSPHVGRALWTIDVDGDERNDLMITHSNEQLRLLVNRGRDIHNRIAFKLVGTNSSRDAIGAVIRFTAAGQPQTLWLLSGHGYMCSNEQVLRGGLGKAEVAENVTVTWPDGSSEQLGTLDANSRYLIVQGQRSAFKLD